MSRSKTVQRPHEPPATVRVERNSIEPTLADEAAEAIEQLEDVVLDVQETLAERSPEANADSTVSEVTKIVEGPKQRAALQTAHRAVEKLDRASRAHRKR